MGPRLILSSPPATPGCLLQTPSREVGRGGKWVWDGGRWRRGGGSRDQRSREQRGQEAEEEKKKKTIDKMPAHSGCRRKPAKEIQRGRNKGEGETQQGLKQSHGENKGKQKNEGTGRSSHANKERSLQRPPESHARILQGRAWAKSVASTSLGSLTSSLVPTGSQEPLGQTAGPPPASPAQRALIGQSTRAREAGHAHPSLLLRQGKRP